LIGELYLNFAPIVYMTLFLYSHASTPYAMTALSIRLNNLTHGYTMQLGDTFS
jgi:hypothetical protein